jgi:hypothetical protein
MENVPQYDVVILHRIFGKDYMIVSTVICPRFFGWASRRPRRYTMLVSKSEMEVNCAMVSFSGYLKMMRRLTSYTIKSYMIASEAELNMDLAWAKARPKSLATEDEDDATQPCGTGDDDRDYEDCEICDPNDVICFEHIGDSPNRDLDPPDMQPDVSTSLIAMGAVALGNAPTGCLTTFSVVLWFELSS